MDETRRLLELTKEICTWLASQRGMIPKDMAKDLAKQISLTEKELNARSIQNN